MDDGYGEVALTITEGNRPIGLLTTAASIIDADSAATNYGGVSVLLEREGGADRADLFGARGLLAFEDLGRVVWDSEVVGTATRANGRLEIVFNESASHSDFDGVLRALTYYNSSQQPESRVRLRWTVNDNDPVGALSTSAVQTINIQGDRADVGDPTIVTSLNGGPLSLTDHAELDGRHYYVVAETRHDDLDDRFNAGADTTDSARSVTSSDGSTYILLTEAELGDLLAHPDRPDSYEDLRFSSGFWTATLGDGPGEHIANAFGSISSSWDNNFHVAVVEVLPSPFAPTGPVEPHFELAQDNGESSSDNLSSNGLLEILGFERALAFEFSLDGGATWTSRPAGSDPSFVLPVGIHPVGRIMARQVDQSGFETEIASTVAYNIDQTTRSMQLLNDQGLSTRDNVTADGRVIILNFEETSPWEYSIDGGQNWQSGGPLAGGLGFLLPDGVYGPGSLRVRQVVDGFVTGTTNNSEFVIESLTGQGTVSLAADTGSSATDGLTGDSRVNVTGLVGGLAWELSTDGGVNWQAGDVVAGSVQSFDLPEGVYPIASVRARQTDASGFEVDLGNTIAFNIDKTIRSLKLLNDQGLSTRDNVTADGRVLILNFEEALPWEYSIDDGQNWQSGGPLAGGLGFVLPDGTYPAGTLRVRQDVSGFLTEASSNTQYTIDPLTGQGVFRLVIDTGSSSTDGLTTDPRVSVTGLVGGLAWEFSTDGGSNWQAGTVVTSPVQSFDLPEGIHPVAGVRARQTDAAGFEVEIANTMAFNLDRTIRTLQLLNDQGISTRDNATADGRVVILNFAQASPWEYSIDDGQSWQSGGPLAGGLGFVLPDGTYPAGTLRARQEIAGFFTEASSQARFIIDPVQGQGLLDLAADIGTSASDGLTAEPRVTVTGLVGGLAWEYSTDSGASWQAGTVSGTAIQSLILPEGDYAVGSIRARQTDTAGFELTLSNTAAYTIDRSIGGATITLVNDTGISATDLTSADGTVSIVLTGLSAGDTWEYTIDGGAFWTPGVGTVGIDIVLPDGSYAAHQVQVRLSDEAGNQVVADFDRNFRIDNSDVTGPVFTSASRAVVLDPDGAGTTTIPTSRTLYTPAVSDVNLVVFSLSGAGAADFQIDAVTGRLTFAAATGLATGGPNSRSVTIVATDLFGNPGSMEVTVEVVGPPTLVSTSPVFNGSMASAGSISFTFDQPIQIGSGDINLFDRRSWDDFVFDVTDATQVSVSGNTLTIRPTTPLPDRARMTAYCRAGTVMSLDGFPWAGIDPFVYDFDVTSSVLLRPDGVAGLPGEVKIGLAPEDQSQSNHTSDVSMAGDVNGDGRDDILVSVPNSDPQGRVDAGRVYLIFGSDSMDEIDLADVSAGTGGFVINGLAAGDQLGTAAVGVGDFDGDGKSDLALTAPGVRGGIGEAYMIYGKTNGAPVDLTSVRAGIGGFAIQGEDAVRNFNEVAAIGDFNGDGKADVAFASTGALVTVTTVNTEDEVKTWTTTRTWQTVDVETIRIQEPVTIVNPFSVASFLSDPADFVLENAFDLYEDPKEVFAPEVELQEKTQTTTTTTTWTETILHRQVTRFTHTLTKTSPSAGIVYVLFGGHPAAEYRDLTVSRIAKPFSTLGFSISGTTASEELGNTMSPIGDINNDGHDDFYVAGYFWSGRINNGYVVLGNPSSAPGNLTSYLLSTGDGGYQVVDTSGIGAGDGAAPLGDVNGDGFSDFAVGSVGGPILVVHGRAGSNQIDLAAVNAGNGGYPINPDGADKPKSLVGLGDVNGDGIADLLASNDNSRNAKAWVIYGRSGTSAVELRDVSNGSGGFRLESPLGGIDGMAGAGDFDGDGLHDFAFLLNNAFGAPYLWLLPGSTVGVSH